jgi:dihydroorotate dehydrogenase (NAD+) catalytic subunit
MLAGASAVQVGTATFADPRACFKIAGELSEWATRHGLSDIGSLTGLAHRGGLAPL